MICPKCKREIKNSGNFCAYCGTKMTSEFTLTQKTRKEDFVSGDISHHHLIKFIRHMLQEKKYGIFIYEIILFIVVLQGAYSFALDPYFYDGSAVFRNVLLWWLIIPGITIHFSLNNFGQKILCVIMGAHRIERNELMVRLKNPVEAIIHETRANGLALPNDIEIYVVKYSEPIAYAIGMNTIIVSEQMASQNETVFKAKILTELYRINQMDTDYLLFMIGSNLFTSVIAICLSFISRIYIKYGDRRTDILGDSERKNGAVLFYGILICFGIWIGICYLCIRKAIRENASAADLYVASKGYGESLCLYLDRSMPEKLPMRYKILELGHPSKDKRIAALQKAGVTYFN